MKWKRISADSPTPKHHYFLLYLILNRFQPYGSLLAWNLKSRSHNTHCMLITRVYYFLHKTTNGVPLWASCSLQANFQLTLISKQHVHKGWYGMQPFRNDRQDYIYDWQRKACLLNDLYSPRGHTRLRHTKTHTVLTAWHWSQCDPLNLSIALHDNELWLW